MLAGGRACARWLCGHRSHAHVMRMHGRRTVSSRRIVVVVELPRCAGSVRSQEALCAAGASIPAGSPALLKATPRPPQAFRHSKRGMLRQASSRGRAVLRPEWLRPAPATRFPRGLRASSAWRGRHATLWERLPRRLLSRSMTVRREAAPYNDDEQGSCRRACGLRRLHTRGLAKAPVSVTSAGAPGGTRGSAGAAS